MAVNSAVEVIVAVKQCQGQSRTQALVELNLYYRYHVLELDSSQTFCSLHSWVQLLMVPQRQLRHSTQSEKSGWLTPCHDVEMTIRATYVEPRIPERRVAGTWQDLRREYWLSEVGYINGHTRYVRKLDESLPLHH